MEMDVSAVNLHVLPYRIQSKRYNLILKIAKSKGYGVREKIGPDVTHLVTELPSYTSIKKYVSGTGFSGKIVNLNWFLDSNRENKLQPESGYEILQKEEEEAPESKKQKFEFDFKEFNKCVPERRAPLNPPNKNLAVPLDFLAHYWLIMWQTGEEQKKELAFSRAAAAIKCIPFKVSDARQIRGVKDLGEAHSFRVVKEVLETGKCEEVEEKKNDPEFQARNSFAEVFQAGAVKAKQWYNQGFQNIWDLRNSYRSKSSETDLRILYGLAYYEDLTTPVMSEEGQRIYDFVCEMAKEVLPGARSYKIGGFRRGKTSGHDVDILFTHDEEGAEEALGPELAKHLEKRNLIFWSHFTKSPENEGKPSKGEKDFPIRNKVFLTMTMFKYPLDGDFSRWKDGGTGAKDFEKPVKYTGDPEAVFAAADSHRPWKAVRVDFVTAPKSQWAYAYMGWTGNKNYLRILRQYLKVEKGIKINNSGLWDTLKNVTIPANSEEEIFNHIGISYRPPTERNF